MAACKYDVAWGTLTVGRHQLGFFSLSCSTAGACTSAAWWLQYGAQTSDTSSISPPATPAALLSDTNPLQAQLSCLHPLDLWGHTLLSPSSLPTPQPHPTPHAGILVGTLGVAGYRDAIQRLRAAAQAAGKKTYTLLMGKPSPAKLANFPEIEASCLSLVLLLGLAYTLSHICRAECGECLLGAQCSARCLQLGSGVHTCHAAHGAAVRVQGAAWAACARWLALLAWCPMGT